MKKNLLKRFAAVALTGAMAMTLMACGGSNAAAPAAPADAQAPAAEAPADDAAAPAEGEAKEFTVGICNWVDDASLNQICDNIQSSLEAFGAENGVKFNIEYDNCQADSTLLNQIIANFEADNVDLMVGIATPVAMAMQAATEESKTPVVFAAVSDPVACGVVDSMDAPGGNLTGTSDYLDTDAIMNLIFAANPDADCVGLLYDQGQDASTTPIAAAKAYLEAKGVKCVEKTGTTTDEVLLAAQSLVDAGAKAIFTPSDNTIMTAELTIYEYLKEAGVPHYAGADSFALNGAFCGYGVDYANLGAVTGEMIADILVNGKDVATYPVKTFDNGIATVNTEICEAMGWNYDDIAATFAPLCTQVKPIETAEDFN